jgi:hypothetical protein
MNEPPGTNGECSTARRADRLEAFPAALAIAGDDLGTPTFLRLVERWRTANALVTASMDELVASPGRPSTAGRKRFADRITQALAPHVPGRDELPPLTALPRTSILRCTTYNVRMLSTLWREDPCIH